MSVSCQVLPVCPHSGQRAPHQVLETNFPFLHPTLPLPSFLASPGSEGSWGTDKTNLVGWAPLKSLASHVTGRWVHQW